MKRGGLFNVSMKIIWPKFISELKSITVIFLPLRLGLFGFVFLGPEGGFILIILYNI